ncbi:MAG: NAD-binding protein [Luteitalea sp.]|nr:NAD-binding protein [Luteitalea sp.]
MNIGFIGTGVMGKPMARNVIETGNPVTIFARHPEKIADLSAAGAEVADSPAELASRSECIFLSLPTDSDVEAVVLGDDGILQAARPNTVVVDTTTGAPRFASRIASALTEHDIFYLDAPVSGGVKGAREGTLTLMLGGESAVVDRVRSVLDAVAANVYLVGPVGAGRTLKALNQMMAGLNAAVLCESLVLAKRAGVSPETFLSVLGKSAGNSYQLQTKLPQFIIPKKFDGGFRISLMLKDLDIVLEMARELQTPTLLTALGTQLYRAAGAAGYRDKDTSALFGFLSSFSDAGS